MESRARRCTALEPAGTGTGHRAPARAALGHGRARPVTDGATCGWIGSCRPGLPDLWKRHGDDHRARRGDPAREDKPFTAGGPTGTLTAVGP